MVACTDMDRVVKVIYLQGWPNQERGRESVGEVILSWYIQNDKELARQSVFVHVYINIHGSIIHNNQKVKAAPVPINRLMNN